MADDFKGLMNVWPEPHTQLYFPLGFAWIGAIVLEGSAVPGSGPAVLAGDEAHIFGYVYGVSLAEIQAPTIFESTSQISVDMADDQLTLKGDSTLRGANIIGDGTLKQLADITVEADTAIDTAVYDWGNSLPGMVHDTTVSPDIDFTVNSPETGQDSNEYRGTIHLNNGALYVQTSSGWTLPSDGGSGDDTLGTLILHNNNEDRTVPQVRGADLTLGGLLEATGGLGIIGPALITQPTGEIDVQTAATLSLEGHVTYDGPLVHGVGTLIQNANANVISSTTIATNIFDWDGDIGWPVGHEYFSECSADNQQFAN